MSPTAAVRSVKPRLDTPTKGIGELSKDQLNDLAVQAKSDVLARNRLAEEFHSVMWTYAYKASRSACGLILPEDLVSYGFFGLVRAIKSFSYSQGDFRPWAFLCIRGDIFDAVRRFGAGRSLHKKKRPRRIREVLQSNCPSWDRTPAKRCPTDFETDDLVSHLQKSLSPEACKFFDRLMQGQSPTAVAQAMGIRHKRTLSIMEHLKERYRQLAGDR